MNDVSFRMNIKACKAILEEYNVLKRENLLNIEKGSYTKYSEAGRKFSQKDNYAKAYMKSREMDDYDYLLKDGSFIQFSCDIMNDEYIIRMSYYPAINETTYESFLQDVLELEPDECGSEFIDDYQQYISEQEQKAVTPLRYDYNSDLHKKLVHSASHLHFGNLESIRVPTNRIIFPTAFVKLIIQYYYYDEWKKRIENDEKLYQIRDTEKKRIDKKYWNQDEKEIPFISFEPI